MTTNRANAAHSSQQLLRATIGDEQGCRAGRNEAEPETSFARFRASEQLIEESHCLVDLRAGDMQRGRERNYVLVVAADIQNKSDFFTFVVEVAGKTDVNHAIKQCFVRRKAIWSADLRTQRETQAVHVSNLWMAALQIL